MNIPIRLLRRFIGSDSLIWVGALIAIASMVIAATTLWAQIDPDEFRSFWEQSKNQPERIALGLSGFTLAFALRSYIWTLAVSRHGSQRLSFAQSWSAIHVALGANHALPFRLGEPLRVVSVVKRAGLDTRLATASTVALRASDILTLVLLGALLGPALMAETLFPANARGWTIALFAVGLCALAALMRVARSRGLSIREHLPSPGLFALIGSAWLLEAILVWQIATLVGADLNYLDAALVTSVAVSAQLIAIAPGGLGTYEAAATAALVLTGIDASKALTIAVTTHLLKTLYSLTTGAIAMVFPRPGFLGNTRVPKSIAPARIAPIGDGPVVLFMPAFQEGPRIAEAITRTPDTSFGRKVIRLVIDDGSSDDTVKQAKSAGAAVHSFTENKGLGAAVADGLRRAVTTYGACIVVFCDADGEYDPADIDDLVAPILNAEADYVIGSRFAGDIEHMRPHRRFGNLTLTRWVQWMARTPVSDGQSGYRALSAQAALAAEMAHDYNYAQVLTLDLIQKGFRYHEVPISYHFRESGDSFVKLGVYLRAVLPAVWRLLNPTGTDDTDQVLVLDDVLSEGAQQDAPTIMVPGQVSS